MVSLCYALLTNVLAMSCWLTRAIAASRLDGTLPSRARLLATSTQNTYKVFNRDVKRLQRDLAARGNRAERSRVVDYIRDEAAEGLIERFLVRVLYKCPMSLFKSSRMSKETLILLWTLVADLDTFLNY